MNLDNKNSDDENKNMNEINKLDLFPPFGEWMKINYPLEWTCFNGKGSASHEAYYGPTDYYMQTYSIMQAYNYNGRFKDMYMIEKENFVQKKLRMRRRPENTVEHLVKRRKLDPIKEMLEVDSTSCTETSGQSSD